MGAPGTSVRALTGEFDAEVIATARKMQGSQDLTWNFWLSRMEEGGNIMTCWSSSDDIPCCKFLLEISAPGGIVITHRSNRPWIFDLRTRLLMR